MYFSNSIRPENLRTPQINTINDTKLSVTVSYRDCRERKIDGVYCIYDDHNIITILSYNKNFVIPIDMIKDIEIVQNSI